MSNHLTLTGNVVRDPELRYAANGTARVVLPVATNRRFQPKGAEQATEVVSFFTVIVWGTLAEHVSESLMKGDRVTVSGRVEQRSWVDEAQQRHSSFEIVADDVAASLRFRSARIDRTARASVANEDLPGEVTATGFDEPGESTSDGSGLLTSFPGSNPPRADGHDSAGPDSAGHQSAGRATSLSDAFHEEYAAAS
jgi:single-strand DNA-binding protein